MTSTVTMYDATHANVAHIPAGAQKVAGYITGTPDVQWTAEDWARFPKAGHVQIDQGYGAAATSHNDVHVLKVIDSEPGAFSAATAAQLVLERVRAGIKYTTIYCDRNDAPKMIPALKAADPASHRWYIGHVRLWLAAPGLTEAEATAIIGTEYHGILCRAVQYAQGGGGVYDISVTDAGWYPPPAPPQPELEGILVQLPGGGSRKVLSHDGGHTWQ